MKKSFRGKYNWVQVLHSLGNQDMENCFFALLSKMRKGKSMSANRCAYCVLKSWFSTTIITQLKEKLGL